MRDLDPVALAKIAEREGNDPLILVQIFWDEQVSIIYGDRKITTEGVRGGLLSLGDIENVINTSQGSNTGSISISLDDTDGELKTIYDTHDIHRRPVYVLQWFPDLPLSKAFVVFDGVISSPIVWSEAERTLSFEVLSKVEELEVGYSAEEGNFTFIPQNIVGRAWPLAFGTVLQVPCIQINESPDGSTLDDTGIDGLSGVGDSLSTPLGTINNEQRLTKEQLNGLVIFCLQQATSYSHAADEYTLQQYGVLAPRLKIGTGYSLPGSDGFKREQADSTLDSLASQEEEWRVRASEYANLAAYGYPSGFQGGNYSPEDAAKIADLNGNSLRVDGGSNYPQGTNIVINVNGADYEGYFEGDVFQIKGKTHPFTNQSAVAGPTTIVDKGVATEHITNMATGTFFYAIAGSTVKIGGDSYPIHYIVGIHHLTKVVAYAKFNGKMRLVPRSYYSIVHRTFGTLNATTLVMGKPLSSRDGWDSDDIWCNVVSPVGPNGCDVLEWLIENYSDGVIDAVSFAEVRPLIAAYGCNFVLTERPNCLDLLKDIAYQLRCAIYYKGGKFYLKYLPKKYTPVDTITEDDVEAGTLSVYSTDTEEIITKWAVTWRKKANQEKDFSIIYRYHIKKYGLHASTYDAFCFNNQKAVEKFALFWLVRNANTWKKISFSTFLTKLHLETFDSVLIDFANPWVNDPGCTETTVGIVESATYNSDTKKIDLVIWLPIRLGEMCPYDYAYPSGLGVTYVFPKEFDVLNGNTSTDIPGATATGDLYDQTPQIGLSPIQVTGPNYGSGGNSPVGDSTDTTPGKFDPPTVLDPDNLVNRGAPTEQPQIRQLVLKPLKDATPYVEIGTFPGYVLSKISGTDYKVNVHLEGLGNNPTELTVKQITLHEDDTIPPNTGVIVSRNALKISDGLFIPEYTMQVPVWLSIESDDAANDVPPDIPTPLESTEPPVAEPAPEADAGDQ